MAEQSRQYLTFQLAGQDYGVQITQVREIRAWERPTRLPNAPEYVEGVIHVRGNVLPILDLRRRFGLGDTDRPRVAVVVVVQSDATRDAACAGLVVDAVSDVCEIDASSIQSPPEMINTVGGDWVYGLCSERGRLLILLDVERLTQRTAAPAVDASAAA